MGYMIRQVPPSARLSDEHALEALAGVMPQQTVRGVVAELGVGEARRRKLPAQLMLLLAVAMHLFPEEALDRVLFKLLRGLRLLWPEPCPIPATKGAICQARYLLGPRPVAALFHRVCRPLATPQTPGAFRFGLRVMALDGTLEHVPDSGANARYFGRPSNQYGPAAFPQVWAAYLVECGTHAVVDAGFWPCLVGEHVAARRLLRSVRDGMLVLYDAGLHSAELVVDELDTHQRLARQPLRSRKPLGILQELYGLLLAHYAVRAVMVDAAAQIPLDPRRLSFVHAVQLVCDALPEFQMVAPEYRPALYGRLLADLGRHRLPQRANRLNPRVVKRTRRRYPPKRAIHERWPQPTTPFIEAVVMLD